MRGPHVARTAAVVGAARSCNVPNKPRKSDIDVAPVESHIFNFTIADDHKGTFYNTIPELPELHMVYIAGANRLQQYVIPPVQAGDLSLTLNVNGHEVKLSDWDQRKGIVNRLIIEGHEYTFQGLESDTHEIPAKLKTLITRSSTPNVVSHEAGKPFILEFPSNPSTGHNWNIVEMHNVQVLSQNSWSKCSTGLACEGATSFVLLGLNKGPAKITLTYSDSSNSGNHKEITFLIV